MIPLDKKTNADDSGGPPIHVTYLDALEVLSIGILVCNVLFCLVLLSCNLFPEEVESLMHRWLREYLRLVPLNKDT